MSTQRISRKIRQEKPVEPTTQQPSYSWFLLWALPIGILALLGVLVYTPSLNYSFQFDDLANITKFFSIRHQTFRDMFFYHSRWIATWLNAVNYRMGNFEPFYYRLFNVLFHIATSFFIFGFIQLGLRNLRNSSFFKQHSFSIAFCTGVLFLLHPVQTQTVSYIIQGRLEGLAGFFVSGVALTFLLFTSARSTSARYAWGTLCFVLASLACGTKEVAIVTPVLVVITDWFFVAQGDLNDFKKRWMFHVAMFLLVGGLYMYYLKPQFFVNLFGMKMEYYNNIGNTITENRTDKILPMHYFISEFKVILHYLGIFIWPFNISVDYDWKMVKNLFAPDCLFPLMGLIAIFAVMWSLFKKDKGNLIVFGMLWFFISIAPRATFMPSTELIADYKTYLASIGWLFVLAVGVVYLVYRAANAYQNFSWLFAHSAAQLAVLSVIAVPIGFATYQRNKVWRSAEEFWGNILENAPGRARVHNNYGVALSEQGKYKEAIPFYVRATRMDYLYADPWNNLAVAYSVTGKLDNGIEALKQSLKINPYYPEAYNNLASFLIEKKDLENAEKMLSVALQLRPHYGKAFYNLHRVWVARANLAEDPQLKQDHMSKAWALLQDACTKADFDNNLMGLQEFARVSMELQKYDEAIFALTKMVELNPTLHEAVFLTGNVYFFKKDYKNAARYYQEMLRRVPNDIRAWNNLGESYYYDQNFQLAVTCLTKVAQLNPTMLNPQLRLAECLERVGKIGEAKGILQATLSRDDLPEQTRTTIVQALAKADQVMQQKTA